jgi:adenine phosphoribosyltransferase
MPVELTNDQELSSYLRDKIRMFGVRPGLEFPDVTPLLMDPEAFQIAIDALKRRYEDKQITHVVSCESRGFIFGAPLALALKVPFVLVRRAQLLPGKTVGVDYTSGFYTGRMEMHEDAMTKGARVVIIDDTVATVRSLAARIPSKASRFNEANRSLLLQGNTLKVTGELIEKLEGEVIECGCIVDMISRKVRFVALLRRPLSHSLLTKTPLYPPTANPPQNPHLWARDAVNTEDHIMPS